jgi:hypothetical protein
MAKRNKKKKEKKDIDQGAENIDASFDPLTI